MLNAAKEWTGRSVGDFVEDFMERRFKSLLSRMGGPWPDKLVKPIKIKLGQNGFSEQAARFIGFKAGQTDRLEIGGLPVGFFDCAHQSCRA